jgi:hypothetical protein
LAIILSSAHFGTELWWHQQLFLSEIEDRGRLESQKSFFDKTLGWGIELIMPL